MFGSRTKFPYRVRIHDKECGAVARALHHETKIHSLSAVFENVSSTTFERKLMSTKTSFKRIALAVVAALGFGLLTTTSPANAAIDTTLTVSAPSATSAAHNETVTVAVDVTFVATTAGETMQVLATFTDASGNLSDGTGFTNYRIQAVSADSANVTGHGAEPTSASGVGGVASPDSVTATLADVTTRAKFNIVLYKAVATSTDRVITGTIVLKDRTNTTLKTSSFTVTVTKPNTTATAAKSKLWLNNASNPGTTPSEADSTLVVSRGTAGSYTAVGYIWPLMLNSADTKTVTGPSGSTVVGTAESIVVTLTGPGALALSSAGKSEGSKLKSVTVGLGETVVVYNDGTGGTATLQGSIGGTYLTQASKTIAFVGAATTFTAALETSTVTRGAIAYDVVSFTAKDANGNLIVTANQGTGYPGGFYAISSDSGVAGSSLTKGSSLKYVACDYNSSRAKWVCDLAAADSGTATIQIGDSLTVATSSATSSALTLTVAGTGNTGTVTLPKASYNIGEKAILTVTSKDGDGRLVTDGTSTPFSGLRWGSTSPTFGAPTGSDATGGNASSGLTTYLDGGGSFVSGTDTLVVYMPTVTGTYTLIGVTGGATTESTILTFTVVDPNQAATLAAAEAATDAAAEAIDAANAATDAANLAAEAADAATVAAEEARDAADAATAAVEELATAVATLMAALKAQVTTLANTVAKIAKKVGVKK